MKSYFYGDGRKQIQDLLSEAASVDGVVCDGELEALVLEARLIGRHEPKYNRRGKTWRRGAYLKLDPSEAYPRLKVVRAAKPGDGCVYLGPFGGGGAARLAKEGLEEIIPLRRCTAAMRAGTRFAPCALADIGRCPAPCDGRTDPERYGELVRHLVSSLTTSPGGLLEALERRMASLAEQERYEEAASVRDRLRALAEALWRARQDAWLGGRRHPGSARRRRHGAAVRPRRVDPGRGSGCCRNPSRSPARVSAPTSSPPCARGCPGIPRASRDATARHPASPWTGAPPSPGSWRRCARRSCLPPPAPVGCGGPAKLVGMENAVILEGARTPIGKFLGSFAQTPAVELGELAAKEALRRANVPPEEIDQTILGHARQAGNGPNTGRQVSIRAGVPQEVSAYNVNLACGSGMKATQLGAQQIMLGDAEVVLVGGMENMTRVPYLLPDMRLGYRLGNTEVVDAMYRDGLLDPLCGLIMGETAENLVDMYDISREEQDAFALESHRKAVAAKDRRAAEMFPVEATVGRTTVTVTDDEHVRPDTTLETLGKLAPVFREGGSVTAGNSSGITDGAAAMVLMSESRAKAEGREPLARIIGMSWAGVDPKIMGIAPVPATKKVMERTGLSLADMDVIEINEAFAAQVIACDRELKFDRDKLERAGAASRSDIPSA